MNVRRAILVFVPIAIAVTAMSGLVYLVAQQGLRSDGNDPQRQIAEDAAAQLDRGTAPVDVVGDQPIDIGRSLAPFIVVYAADGSVVATDGQLEGARPQIPKGVLDEAKAKGSNAVTWQPQPGVRIATITIPWRDGTVPSGARCGSSRSANPRSRHRRRLARDLAGGRHRLPDRDGR
jgi:hypothetical protein